MTDFLIGPGSSPLVPDVHLVWIEASSEQKMAITIDNVNRIDSDAWGPMELAERQAFINLCWNIAQKLRIVDRSSFAYFCYYSLCWGMYFYLDPRWGYNRKVMEDLDVPAQIRLERVFANISLIEQSCYGENLSIIKPLIKYYSDMDLAHALPYEIGDMVRLLEITFKRYWPERLEHLPLHYFQNSVVYMKSQCHELRLYGEWDLLLTSALSLTVGRYFFHDPAFEWLARAFFVKDRLTGRDKMLKILRIAQAVVRKNIARAV